MISEASSLDQEKKKINKNYLVLIQTTENPKGCGLTIRDEGTVTKYRREKRVEVERDGTTFQVLRRDCDE